MKRHPSILDYLHAPQGTYPTIDRPMPRAPVNILGGYQARDAAMGAAPQFRTGSANPYADALQAGLALHGGQDMKAQSLASVLAPPLATPETPELPITNFGLDAAAATPQDMSRIRTPRIVRPGDPTPAADAALRAQEGPLDYLVHLLGPAVPRRR